MGAFLVVWGQGFSILEEVVSNRTKYGWHVRADADGVRVSFQIFSPGKPLVSGRQIAEPQENPGVFFTS